MRISDWSSDVCSSDLRHRDPLDRVMAYLDFRRELVAGEVAEFTCLVGTMAQETFLTNPAIRDACFESISGHAETLEADLAEAIEAHGLPHEMDAKSMSLHTQEGMPGASILAKGKDTHPIATDKNGR